MFQSVSSAETGTGVEPGETKERDAIARSANPRDHGTVVVRIGGKPCTIGRPVTEASGTISITGMLDFVGGFFLLVPWLGFIAPGFWELSRTTVSVGIPDESACE